jgi:acyl-homoserine-lactone acylase
VINPPSGYVFNSNHSPFLATAAGDNIRKEDYDPTMGYETNENNRSKRFMELVAQNDKIGYEDFKRIKYDLQLPSQLAYKTNCDTLFMLKEDGNSDVASLIIELNQWNRQATIESKGATIFGIIYYQVQKERSHGANYKSLSKDKCLELLRFAKMYLLKNFKTTDVSLGQYQKLVRGTKAIPLPGLPDVIASMLSVPYKDGQVKGDQGESYIELVKFTKQGPEIETINCYGASNNPNDAHFSDQMELFVHQKTKPMMLDKEKIYKEAKKIYHPK